MSACAICGGDAKVADSTDCPNCGTYKTSADLTSSTEWAQSLPAIRKLVSEKGHPPIYFYSSAQATSAATAAAAVSSNPIYKMVEVRENALFENP